MKSILRPIFAISLFAFAAAAGSACDLTEEPSPSTVVPEEDSLVTVTSTLTPLEEGVRPISAAELEEVRRAVGLAATVDILASDGETMKLEEGVTSIHEGSLNGVDITFKPTDAAGRPSRKNLEVVYQRSDTAAPHFFFVSGDSGLPSAVPVEPKGDGPISSLCIIGNPWSGWSDIPGTAYCGFRKLCSKRKWDNEGWFVSQKRSRMCMNGTIQTQTRLHFVRCGCYN